MIEKTDFLENVKNTVVPILEKDEETRKKIVLYNIKIPFIFVILSMLTPFFPIILILWFIVFGRKVITYANKQKEAIIIPICNCFGNFYKEDRLDDAIIKQSGLYDYKITSDDCFYGNFNNTNFALKEIVSRTKRKNHSTRIIMIHIPMNKIVNGHSIITPCYNFFIKSPFKKTSIEDPVFMEKYSIITTDEIELRRILTPAFIERLNGLETIFNGIIKFAFFDNQALFSIELCEKNLFEPYSIFKPITSTEPFEKFYDEIKSIYDLTKTLNIENEK